MDSLAECYLISKLWVSPRYFVVVDFQSNSIIIREQTKYNLKYFKSQFKMPSAPIINSSSPDVSEGVY